MSCFFVFPGIKWDELLLFFFSRGLNGMSCFFVFPGIKWDELLLFFFFFSGD